MQGRKLTQHSLPSRKEPSQQSWILWRVCEKEWAGPLQHHRLFSSSTWQIFAYSRVSGKKIRRIDSTSQNTCYIMYFHWKVTSIKLRKGIWEGNILNCELSSQSILQILSIFCMHSTVQGALRAFPSWYKSDNEIKTMFLFFL